MRPHFRGRGKSCIPRKSEDQCIVERDAVQNADISAKCVHAASAVLLMTSASPTSIGSLTSTRDLAHLDCSASWWREQLSWPRCLMNTASLFVCASLEAFKPLLWAWRNNDLRSSYHCHERSIIVTVTLGGGACKIVWTPYTPRAVVANRASNVGFHESETATRPIVKMRQRYLSR